MILGRGDRVEVADLPPEVQQAGGEAGRAVGFIRLPPGGMNEN